MNLKIRSFRARYQPKVDDMFREIQSEFEEPFTSAVSLKMKDAANIINSKFWVLKDGRNLAGTIGMIKMKDNSAAVKSLFVSKIYRSAGAASILLQVFMDHAVKKNITRIYLGTMNQMKAAQKFYEKNGFARIAPDELPEDFPANILDTVFYYKKID